MSARRLPIVAVGDMLQLWLVMAFAAATWWPIYQSSDFLVMAVGAVVLGTAVAVSGAVFRWPAPSTC